MQGGMLAEIQLDAVTGGMTEGMMIVTEAGVMIPDDETMTAAIAGVTDHLGVSLTRISMMIGTDKMTLGATGLVLVSLEVARELRSWTLKWTTSRSRCVTHMPMLCQVHTGASGTWYAGYILCTSELQDRNAPTAFQKIHQ